MSVGSFVETCASRIPQGMSIISPRSFCDHCHRPLRWFEVVPLVSFVIQRGRCRSCSGSIPLRHPVIEIVTGGLAGLLFAIYGLSMSLLVGFSFISLMLLIAITDWKHFLIPNKVVAVGIGIGLALQMAFTVQDCLSSLLAMTCATGTMLLIRSGGQLLFRQEAMGMGDVKLSALIALFVGFQGFLFTLWAAAVAGSLFGLLRQVSWVSQRRHAQGEIRIALGSFLAAGGCVVMLLQDRINSQLVTWLTWMQ